MGLWVYQVLWVRKWDFRFNPWLNLTFNPTFITRPIFPFRLLKNSLSFVEKLKLKNKKQKKQNLGGLSTCSYDSNIIPIMFIHWHTYSNNLNRPKCQVDHPNFGGIEWKTQKWSVVYSTTNNNQGKKHSGLIGLTNTVQETESFTDTTMLEHFITTPPRGYEHVVDKKNTS